MLSLADWLTESWKTLAERKWWREKLSPGLSSSPTLGLARNHWELRGLGTRADPLERKPFWQRPAADAPSWLHHFTAQWRRHRWTHATFHTECVAAACVRERLKGVPVRGEKHSWSFCSHLPRRARRGQQRAGPPTAVRAQDWWRDQVYTAKHRQKTTTATKKATQTKYLTGIRRSCRARTGM